jgi:hypothetical protein
MRRINQIAVAIALVAGIISTTILFGPVITILGLAFLVMASVVGLVVAAAGKGNRYLDDAP